MSTFSLRLHRCALRTLLQVRAARNACMAQRRQPNPLHHQLHRSGLRPQCSQGVGPCPRSAELGIQLPSLCSTYGAAVRRVSAATDATGSWAGSLWSSPRRWQPLRTTPGASCSTYCSDAATTATSASVWSGSGVRLFGRRGPEPGEKIGYPLLPRVMRSPFLARRCLVACVPLACLL